MRPSNHKPTFQPGSHGWSQVSATAWVPCQPKHPELQVSQIPANTKPHFGSQKSQIWGHLHSTPELGFSETKMELKEITHCSLARTDVAFTHLCRLPTCSTANLGVSQQNGRKGHDDRDGGGSRLR